MKVKEMHPLCCISVESFGIGCGGDGDKSRDEAAALALSRTKSMPASFAAFSDGSDGNVIRRPLGSKSTVAGVLQKWTNYGKGWRSRWFLLRNGVLSYAKIRRPENLNLLSPNDDVRLIGESSSNRIPRGDEKDRGRQKQRKAVGVVHLKIGSFRESKSDDRRFYISTATKTLHLRTNSKSDRGAWIQALASDHSISPLTNYNLSPVLSDLSVSTGRLTKRLVEEGISETLVKDCERIMLSEFSEIQGYLQVLCEERYNLLDTIRQLEAANFEAEASGMNDGEFQLTKHDLSSEERGKYSECSTTESSDDIEKQEIEEVSDEDELSFYDTRDCFAENSVEVEPYEVGLGGVNSNTENYHYDNADRTPDQLEFQNKYSHIQRRKQLPEPVEEEKRVSLWSIIKDNVGKDLTRVCLPVYFNEPISSLQKCCEDMEYSYLLDQAYEQGKQGNSLQRILNVAAFAVSGYASSEGRHCKPFNPLLGETYEADFPEKGIRFFSEKVSHHPTLIACHCEGRGWKFWGDSNLQSKFWGRSIQLDPVGVLTLEFDDGEIFQWSKVTTNIYNLILGKVYCDHHGTMHIRGNRDYSCNLKFKEQSFLDRNPRQVHGYVEDVTGKKVATLFGKWDDSLRYVNGYENANSKIHDGSLLWKSSEPPLNPTRYNLTSFAITLNELTPGLKELLPPTDSRLRPDQRHLENGEYDKANEEKLRLEQRQRISRKLQENGWKPRWFQREGKAGPFRYVGGYWEARKERKWDDCPDIFGESNQESTAN
ncbi:oxysterol-binding protein-related protein 2A-like isoform X1 [Cucurbita moschata]|uniref:Oxysterol-binding protein-related protein 2A-like isoform X1 n=1 Tax=Cucurbita moschata TaxID=3662 RepID=A0A6J1E666_CUCMO|nr:oxysterol-binding protein-related protein 2A-like isoform X1 [Cucurbita moschata]XP_022922299.1 oxysterol-binding protein-related protein 2A-like isoform X1 [Cucurbita moschata]